MYAGHPTSGNGGVGSWSAAQGVIPSSGNSASASTTNRAIQEQLVSYQEAAFKAG